MRYLFQSVAATVVWNATLSIRQNYGRRTSGKTHIDHEQRSDGMERESIGFRLSLE